jgi:hypothetical protein
MAQSPANPEPTMSVVKSTDNYLADSDDEEETVKKNAEKFVALMKNRKNKTPNSTGTSINRPIQPSFTGKRGGKKKSRKPKRRSGKKR